MGVLVAALTEVVEAARAVESGPRAFALTAVDLQDLAGLLQRLELARQNRSFNGEEAVTEESILEVDQDSFLNSLFCSACKLHVSVSITHDIDQTKSCACCFDLRRFLFLLRLGESG